MKIYTKTGDDGTTGLIGGSRVLKNEPAIEAYGAVDELNAAVGWVAVVADEHRRAMLQEMQTELFTIGAHLATPAGEKLAATLPVLKHEWIVRLELQIDSTEAALPALRNFILPGGSELSARLQVARTVCRRVERTLVSLAASCELNPVILPYVNRLSDWLFVHARLANHAAGIVEVAWVSR